MPDSDPLQCVAIVPGPPKLNHTQLLIAQQETLDTPRRPYGLAARVLFRVSTRCTGRNARWASSRSSN